jgi:surface carbohydrate biosynthesis protein (TIGR04326 family)
VERVTREPKPHVREAAATALLLLQTDIDPAGADEECVVLWQGAPRRPGVLSLTAHLDAHAGEIRKRYLAWIYDLGQTPIGGRRLCERFVVPGAGSFWALSLFVEQSTWKQRSLETILKVMALELLLEQQRPAELHFRGSDRQLSRVLKALCAELKIGYSRSKSPPPGRLGARALRGAIPRLLVGMAAQVYFLVRRATLRRPGPGSSPDPAAGRRALICAPFFNHNANQRSGREFTSQYWAMLPELLAQSGLQLHWLHTFYAHDNVPTARAAARIIERINADSPWSGQHSLVDSYLRGLDFVRILVHWCALVGESLLVGAALRSRFVRNPRESFWPLIRRDWANAFRGAECVATLFYSRGFDRALQELPRQDEGIYLMENQGWERALIRAWRKYGHGRLAAVAHSTVRFWDLRYHSDPRAYDDNSDFLPRPHVVVLNGSAARYEYLSTTSRREHLVECEALRYLHLVPDSPRALQRDETVRLLVLGDFMPASTESLLRVVERAAAALPLRLEVWVKPHPNCSVDAPRFPRVALRVVDERVAALVPEVHLVLASNTTSAALDAYASGGRVLVFDDRAGVNFSPLRGVPGALFVHDAPELQTAIDDFHSGRRDFAPRAAGFFNVESDLSRWRAYFGLAASAGSGSS